MLTVYKPSMLIVMIQDYFFINCYRCLLQAFVEISLSTVTINSHKRKLICLCFDITISLEFGNKIRIRYKVMNLLIVVFHDGVVQDS